MTNRAMPHFIPHHINGLRVAAIAGIALLLLACTGAATKSPLNLPEDATNYLTSCRRMVLTSYSSYWRNTGIDVAEGDMILLFGSGRGNSVWTFSNNFSVRIGDGPSTAPFSTYSQSYDYGYFRAPRAGKLKFKIHKLDAGQKLTIDILTFPEKHESELFGILRALREQNPADETLRGQIDGFISDYRWIGYADLEISSSPNGASVYLDDEFKGLTPLRIKAVDKNQAHTICLQHRLFQKICEDFNPANKSRFNFSLTRTATALAEPARAVDSLESTVSPDQEAPRIVVRNPVSEDYEKPVAVSDDTIEIRGRAYDDSGIVWVKINGADANLDPDGTFWSRKVLAVGVNDIEIAARDIHNNTSTQQIKIQRLPVRVSSDLDSSVRREPKMPRGLGTYYLLAIGNNAYEYLPRLETAENDARAIADICEALYGFKVELILNGTRRDILQAMDRYRRDLTEEDNLLIYYAGHGYFDRAIDRGYWLPVDAMEDTSADWISNADVTDKLKVIPAKHVMVVADSCYSGTLTRGLMITARDHDYLSRMARKKSRTVLTSGGLEPVLDGAGGSHSVFASVFIDILHENRQIMDATELFERLRRPVMLRSPQTPQYSDLRLAGHEGGDFLFYRTNP